MKLYAHFQLWRGSAPLTPGLFKGQLYTIVITVDTIKSLFENKVHRSYLITWWSSCFNKLDRDSTQISKEESWGSILPQSLDTTAMAECKVSLWTRCPLSRMKVSTQFKPPASKTAPDSRVHINSKTYSKINRKYSKSNFQFQELQRTWHTLQCISSHVLKSKGRVWERVRWGAGAISGCEDGKK